MRKKHYLLAGLVLLPIIAILHWPPMIYFHFKGGEKEYYFDI